MSDQTPLVFKFATEDWEFEQIHQLNYRTFVEEIPQHKPSVTGRLVDKFHEQNTYLICLRDHQLVGMLAARGNRPFSLDQKLPDLDQHLPKGRSICEIRLLAIDRVFRGSKGGQVLSGMLALLWQFFVEKNYDIAIISGTTRQLKLYQHLGFVPFGPLVGTGDAKFQPMYLLLETFEVTAREFLRNSPARSFQPNAVNFLPGPVAIRREVRRAFEQSPESHRSESFKSDFENTRRLLCELTGARNVALFMGSGTLANDVVGGQISLLGGRGLVLSNGEFGDRLIDHARRFKLDFEPLQSVWGSALDLALIREKLSAQPRPQWLWCVHCETSTGVLNDLDTLKALCCEFEVKLCLDCISSIGAVPVNLRGVHLASCASGKALRSYPGVSIVFHDPVPQPVTDALPRYLDLGYYQQLEIPFTFSSNLLHALHAAVKCVDWKRRFGDLNDISGWLRPRLREMGFRLVGDGAQSSPAVHTIELPSEMPSTKLGSLLQEAGYLVSSNSDYLRRRNWIQICLMGEWQREKVVSLVNALNRICFRRKSVAADASLSNS
ncbi:MAG TPA: aminotransferase class V-fold PLP-dependent enzyme [Verrucomicrobiota bacterium]|nr:aminotransferase class V-fold PLP-dependent enzyme [Verrucomicrobiota bacterium]